MCVRECRGWWWILGVGVGSKGVRMPHRKVNLLLLCYLELKETGTHPNFCAKIAVLAVFFDLEISWNFMD